MDVKHLADTPVGLKGATHSYSGRRPHLAFRVWADDEKERIGEGTHQRAIIGVANSVPRAGKVPNT